jgi:uncharacterized membrane protein
MESETTSAPTRRGGGPGRWLGNTLLAGLVAILPLFLTVWALTLLFRLVDGFLSPVASPLLVLLLNTFAGAGLEPGTRIPGIGLLVTALIILGAGLLVRWVVSRRLLRLLASQLEKVPLAGVLFSYAREFTGLFMQKHAFSQVAAVEYPLRGTWTLGFVTGRVDPCLTPTVDCPMTFFFVSTTPNPTTGFVLLVPEKDVVDLPLTVDEGVRLIVSAGILGGDAPAGEEA